MPNPDLRMSFWSNAAALASSGMALLANGLRLGFALVLLIAFAAKEWLSHFVSRLWLRIVQHNDGVFTLLGIGCGAVFGALKWVISA